MCAVSLGVLQGRIGAAAIRSGLSSSLYTQKMQVTYANFVIEACLLEGACSLAGMIPKLAPGRSFLIGGTPSGDTRTR